MPPPPIDPQRDRTDELVAALAAIPPEPPITLPHPPMGMKWAQSSSVLDITDALQGEWSPQTRPNQNSVIEFLKNPAVERALDRLAAIQPGACRGDSIPRTALRQASKLLVARARLRHATQENVDGAWLDLAALLRISSIATESKDSILLLTAIACEYLAFGELRQMCHEHRLSNVQARRIASALQRECLGQREIWKIVTAGHCGALEFTLDLAYTDDGHGNGWLVLNRLDNLAQPSMAKENRLGAWNALSPLFNDRRTVAEKLRMFRSACEQLGESTYPQSRVAAERVSAAARRFAIVDGPLAQAVNESTVGYLYDMTIRRTATLRACIIATALSAYRHDHDEYPLSIESLTSQYLEAQLTDPLGDQPFRYRRNEQGDDYLLYSVGPNQIDDGGKEIPRPAGAAAVKQEGDILFKHSRGEAYWEPKMVKVTQ